MRSACVLRACRDEDAEPVFAPMDQRRRTSSVNEAFFPFDEQAADFTARVISLVVVRGRGSSARLERVSKELIPSPASPAIAVRCRATTVHASRDRARSRSRLDRRPAAGHDGPDPPFWVASSDARSSSSRKARVMPGGIVEHDDCIGGYVCEEGLEVVVVGRRKPSAPKNAPGVHHVPRQSARVFVVGQSMASAS